MNNVNDIRPNYRPGYNNDKWGENYQPMFASMGLEPRSSSATTGFGSNNKIPKGYRYGRLQQFTPEMMELFERLISYLGPDSPLARMANGDQSYFEEMEKPALRQAGQLQGNMASRYSGQGMGGRHSSGFQNDTSQSMNEFSQGLQSKRTEMMMQAIRDLMGSSSMLLDKEPYEQFLTKKEKKEKDNGWAKFLPMVGSIIGGIFGGPGGAAAGGAAGSAGQQAFS